MSPPVILSPSASLKDRDLSLIFEMARTKGDPETFAMFKKKEPIDDMAKSLLKHRIQTLTGKALSDIEEEMGYPSTREGGGVPVDVLRRLAHFLILEASGQLEPQLPNPVQIQVQEKTSKTSGRKRMAADESSVSQDSSQVADPEVVKKRPGRKSLCPTQTTTQTVNTPTSVKRQSRRSMMPELLSNATVTETVGCRLQPAPKVVREEPVVEEEPMEEDDPIPDEDLGLGSNPTPMMVAQRRKSLAASKAKKASPKKPAATPKRLDTPPAMEENLRGRRVQQTPVSSSAISTSVSSSTLGGKRQAAASEDESPVRNKVAKIIASNPVQRKATKVEASESAVASCRAAPKSAMNLNPPQTGFPGSDGAKIYLANGHPHELNHEICAKLAPGFQGANLTIVHTPVEWDPMNIFNLTKTVRGINSKAKLDNFTVMVGCGLSNVHLFRDALQSQTKHVQLIVFQRDDQNIDTHKDGTMLRDVTSFFLIAYFFPGCHMDESIPPEDMVRPGFTNCFFTKNAEDLENRIVFVLSDKDDWILDLCCKKREISLAAQKMGRNALAIDPSAEMLFMLKDKATAIAEHHDPSFRKNTDGVIQKFGTFLNA